MPRWIERSAEGVVIRVRAQPRAGRTAIAGLHRGALKIRLAAPPVEGRANEVLERFLAEVLGVARGRVRLVGGAKGRDKVISIEGVGVDEASRKIGLDPEP